MNRAITAVAALFLFVASLDAQWADGAPADAPRTPAGDVNIDAPAPRTAAGAPDLSRRRISVMADGWIWQEIR